MFGRYLKPLQRFQRGRYLATYPTHQVVGMPALSPTMTHGTISSWKKQVGEVVGAGDTIAEIETDKASMAFDAVDEMYIAKHLVSAGSEVAVGAPILITVEDPADVAAFSSYTLPTEATPVTPTAPEVKKEAPLPLPPAPPPAPAPAPEKAPVQEIKQIPSQPLSPSPPPPAPKAPDALPTSLPAGLWGSQILKSPLLQKLVQEQQMYQSKYGESLHQPLAVKTSGGEK